MWLSPRCAPPPSSRPTRRCPPASTGSRATLIADFLASGLLRGPRRRARARARAWRTMTAAITSVFNMAVLGLHLGQHANGVSVLHGEVSRGMFGQLWPGVDTDEVPITSITNGVHAPTWVHPAIKARQRARLGRRAQRRARLERSAPCRDGELWGVRSQMKNELVAEARRRVAASASGRAAAEWSRHGSTTCSTRGAHDRLRPPRADVQAPDAHAPRSRAPHEAAHRPRAARCRS